MKIAIGSDHAGFGYKKLLAEFLSKKGIEFKDLGTDSAESVDYPDYAYKVAKEVAEKKAAKGIIICGTGIGVCIAANKVSGIRAATCGDTFSAKAAVIHNNANVLCVGERVVGSGLFLEIADAFLGAKFEGGRHQLRVDKITKIEKENLQTKEKK